MKIVILGHQPHLSLAELESVYPEADIQTLNRQAASVAAEVDVSRLGGSIKVADPLKDVDSIDDGIDFIASYYRQNPPQSKINIGLSYYGVSSPSDLHKKLLSLKKSLRAEGISSRIVNQPGDKILNAAQVKHNNLTSDKGNEWLIVKKHSLFVVAKTEAIQDIDEFSARDQARPDRDAKIGMLPPKLAMMLVNLATKGKPRQKVLDPFCGSGVVLQEALLLGNSVVGSDINQAMVTASQSNLNWLQSQKSFDGTFEVFHGDATKAEWPTIDAVATETYLGPPLTKHADRSFFDQYLDEIDDLHRDFLQNIFSKIESGTRLALALPAWWQPGPRFFRLPLVDHLEKLGYNRLDFKSARRPLIYHRDGQFVARDIIVIERK